MRKKRKLKSLVLSFLVTLAMVIGLMPGMSLTAYADSTHTHDGITFDEWTDALAQEQWSNSSLTAANSLPVKAGNYYLTQDVTLTSKWTVPAGTTNLCLGGKTITGNLSESAGHDSSAVNIEHNSTLNLYDDEEGTGKIVSEEYTFTNEEGRNPTVLVRVVDTFNGIFNMYGGTLCATEGNQVYSGVYVNGGSFTMYGGTIQGARASGVDVASRSGAFTMNGGTITGNRALYGGGVFVQENGTFTMNGGSITGNEAYATETKDADGSPVYKGGQGGGVYVKASEENGPDGVFTMNGGSITGNKAERFGGGVYNVGTFSVSGAPEISGNTHTHVLGDPDADNVYLERDKVVNVADELTGAKPIGITMQREDVFTSGGASGCKDKFASDSEEFVVAVKGNELMLQRRSIVKAASVVTIAPTARNLTYTKMAQELVTKGEAAGGTMQYALGSDGVKAPASSSYTASIPTAADTGTYYVWYKAVGDSSHRDSIAACVEVTIKPADKSDLTDAEKALAEARKKTVKTVIVNTRTVSAKTVDAAVAKAGGSSRYVKTIVLGKKVKKIRKGAFKNYKNTKTLVVKTKKLKKASIRKSLNGSKIRKVKVKVGNKKTSKKYVKKYRKIFTKKIAGRKVKVSR